MEDLKEIDEDEDFDDDSLKVGATEDMSMMDNLMIEGYLMMQGLYPFLGIILPPPLLSYSKVLMGFSHSNYVESFDSFDPFSSFTQAYACVDHPVWKVIPNAKPSPSFVLACSLSDFVILWILDIIMSFFPGTPFATLGAIGLFLCLP